MPMPKRRKPQARPERCDYLNPNSKIAEALPPMPDTKQMQKVERRAAKADLVYLNSLDDGIARVRRGRGFTYRTATGKTLTSKRIRKRIESLVIPPAWNDVVIARQSNGHIQAVGTDDAFRKQYIYHDRWHAISQITKFDRMHLFGKLLPKIRRRVRKDLKSKRPSKTCVVAAVVRLLDKGHLRIGNQTYVDQNGSHGATTLFPEHVEIDDGVVSLDFPGKSGKQRSVKLSDKLVAKVIDKCEDIDGQFLFQYLDEQDEHAQFRPVTSTNICKKSVAKILPRKTFAHGRAARRLSQNFPKCHPT